MNLKTFEKKLAKAGITPYDHTTLLKDPKLVFEGFMQCMAEGDSESALEILEAGLRHMNKSAVARKYKIPRRTLYNLFSKKSVPSLAVVAKVCQAINQGAASKP